MRTHPLVSIIRTKVFIYYLIKLCFLIQEFTLVLYSNYERDEDTNIKMMDHGQRIRRWTQEEAGAEERRNRGWSKEGIKEGGRVKRKGDGGGVKEEGGWRGS